VYVEQKVDPFMHAIEIDSRNAEIAAAVRAHSDEDSVETLPTKIGNAEVTAGSMIQLERDVASLQNLPHLRFDYVAWKAIFRDSEIQHPPRHRRGFENRNRVSHERQIMCG